MYSKFVLATKEVKENAIYPQAMWNDLVSDAWTYVCARCKIGEDGIVWQWKSGRGHWGCFIAWTTWSTRCGRVECWTKPMDGDSESRSQSTSQAPHLWFVLTIFTQALKRKRPKIEATSHTCNTTGVCCFHVGECLWAGGKHVLSSGESLHCSVSLGKLLWITCTHNRLWIHVTLRRLRTHSNAFFSSVTDATELLAFSNNGFKTA